MERGLGEGSQAARQPGRIKFKFCKAMSEVTGFQQAASSGWQVGVESDNKAGRAAWQSHAGTEGGPTTHAKSYWQNS